MPLLDRCKALFESLQHGVTQQPRWIVIPSNQVDKPDVIGSTLTREKHYFQMRVNKIFLRFNRKWTTTYDPMVFVSSEFVYEKSEIAVPFIVGPMMLEKRGEEIPAGMVLSNTRVAGLHPYRGGRIGFTIILYRVVRQDLSRKLLNVVEGTANALDFSTMVSAYTQVAGVILDGVDTLLGLGTTVPVAGYRLEIDPAAGDDLSPRFFALVHDPDDGLDTSKLRVVEDELYDANGPLRSADYVLFSLLSATERNDMATLSFYSMWERVQQEAMNATPDGWKSAKANMLALYQAMMLSPDLTAHHAEMLTDEWTDTMERRHKRAVAIADRAAGEADAMAEIRSRSLRVLDL